LFHEWFISDTHFSEKMVFSQFDKAAANPASPKPSLSENET
jgi:hypothetical protein